MRRFILLCVVSFGASLLYAQENVTIVAPTSEAAEGLDLTAVSELFKDAKDLEEFEKRLNDPETGINNLDLDENGEVDYIRIVEEVAEDTHIIILQVPLGENEFQDVATIEVEKADDDNYNMQVRGNEVIYGPDYYVTPTVVHIHVWPIIPWIYRPVYRPYRSVFYWGFYPTWWRPYHPVTVHVYRTRTVHYTTHRTFTVRKTGVVHSTAKVHYQPRSSTLVKKKTTVVHTPGSTTVKRTTKRTNAAGKTTTVKSGVKRTRNSETGETKVTRKAKKTTKTKEGKTTTTVKRTRKKD